MIFEKKMLRKKIVENRGFLKVQIMDFRRYIAEKNIFHKKSVT